MQSSVYLRSASVLHYRQQFLARLACHRSPTLGSNLSADSAGKTRLGPVELTPATELINWDWHQSVKSQGAGDGVPSVCLLSYQARFVRLALQLIPLFRRTHVSVLHFCMSLFRLSRVAISMPQW